MEPNTIFNNLLHLAGLVEKLDIVVELMRESGYKVSINQVRNWRRSRNNKNYRTAPDFAIEVIFKYLFNEKNKKLTQTNFSKNIIKNESN